MPLNTEKPPKVPKVTDGDRIRYQSFDDSDKSKSILDVKTPTNSSISSSSDSSSVSSVNTSDVESLLEE